jgi:heme-degrading monooxygenase HmoA
MLVTANRIFVAPQFAEQFETNFRNRAQSVDKMPGFIRNQVLRPINAGDPYVVMTFWETRQHFEAWVNSPAFAQGHARSGSLPKEAYTAPTKLEIFEVIQDSSQPDVKPEGS